MIWRGATPCHVVAGLIYVEVPKAGCTSVKRALAPFKGGPPPGDVDLHRWFGYALIPPARLGAWLADREEWAFTLVRDPVARFESFYYGLEPGERGPGDVNRYVLEVLGHDAWASNIHQAPQTAIMGEDLAIFDHVAHTEDMAALGRKLTEVTGRVVEIPHLNRSPRDAVELVPAALERLREYYRRDFEVLGYG